MRLIVVIVFLCATAEGTEEPRLVYPRLLEGRSSDGKLALHIHDDLTLNLEQASVAAPQLRLIEEGDGATVTQLYDGQEINKNLYQERDKLATVAVRRSEGSAEVTGIVGPNHRIEPLQTAERSESGLIPHMVYEIKHTKVYDKALSFVEKGSRFTARDDDEESVPEEVKVEVFIVADTVHHSSFKGAKEALLYVCILLNSVNLRLADMRSPMVKLVLTGMERPSVESYLYGTQKHMHDSRTLSKFQEYGQTKKGDFGNPDIVFLLSGRDVVTDGSGGGWDTRGAGIGYVGGICTSFYVALGEDAPGLFTGVHTVTHEIGHLLGSVHDGSGPSANIDGHPGAEACLWSSGYLMSYVDKGPWHQQFSSCSLSQMRYVLTIRGQACWTVLSTTYNVSRKYPGNRSNITTKICRRAFPNKTNVVAEMVHPRHNECKLKCRYSVEDGIYIKTYSLLKEAPDYMPCGGNRACVRGYCVTLPHIERKKTEN